ncbi:MAG: hypothetical protein LBD24_05205 [Spirochaetaceae bacterium]|nr:hypothetical protein [Spirochaetaceae bacterium]
MTWTRNGAARDAYETVGGAVSGRSLFGRVAGSLCATRRRQAEAAVRRTVVVRARGGKLTEQPPAGGGAVSGRSLFEARRGKFMKQPEAARSVSRASTVASPLTGHGVAPFKKQQC